MSTTFFCPLTQFVCFYKFKLSIFLVVPLEKVIGLIASNIVFSISTNKIA